MIALVKSMHPTLGQTILVQEQFGLALNRAGRHSDAEAILNEVIDQYGPNSETNGILGRVYKDQWLQARSTSNAATAAFLEKAIETYLQGFQSDWRDAYPGINAITLMECSTPPDARREQLIPVVAYCVERRLASKSPDYWDHATHLELETLRSEPSRAQEALSMALTAVREKWEPETTAKNIRLIREARESRGIECSWIQDIENTLLSHGR